MMKTKSIYSLSLIHTGLAITVLSSCGTQANRDKKGNDGATSGGSGKEIGTTDTGDVNAPLVQQDEAVLGESINSQVDEAISSAMEELDTSSGASLALTDGGMSLFDSSKGIGGNGAGKEKEVKNDVIRFRECTEEGAKAVVSFKNSFSHQRDFERKKLKGTTKTAFLLERTRTWSKEGGEVKCNANKKGANIAWNDLKGYELSVSFKGEKSGEQSVTQVVNNTTISRSHFRSNSGTRNIKWLTVTQDAETITLEKQVTNKSERKMSATNKKGESKAWESSLATVEGSPLMISIVRDAKTKDLKTRTIKSGSITAVAKDGTKIETKFDNVVYERGSRCNAVSGKLTGAVYAKDATSASVTYTVNFTGDEPTVEFSDGKSYELNIDGCEFEVEDSKVTEASKKDDVVDPGVKK